MRIASYILINAIFPSLAEKPCKSEAGQEKEGAEEEEEESDRKWTDSSHCFCRLLPFHFSTCISFVSSSSPPLCFPMSFSFRLLYMYICCLFSSSPPLCFSMSFSSPYYCICRFSTLKDTKTHQ